MNAVRMGTWVGNWHAQVKKWPIVGVSRRVAGSAGKLRHMSRANGRCVVRQNNVRGNRRYSR